MHTRLRSALLGGLLALGGCAGLLGEAGDPPGPPPVGRDLDGGRLRDGQVPLRDGEVPPITYECGDYEAAPNPVRRLTTAQYWSSVATIFPGVSMPRVELVASEGEAQRTYENDVDGQTIAELVVERYREAAVAVAQAAARNVTWMPCDLATGAACARQVIAQTGQRAYRRRLTEAERTRFESFVTAAATGGAISDAITMFIEAVLQTPQFLYLPEIGVPGATAPEGMIALRGHELASRLSYFLWNQPPDEELVAAAEAGELSTRDQLAVHVDRLMADDRAAAALDRFFAQWLEQGRLESARSVEFPELESDELRADLAASFTAFMRHAFWEENSFDYLLTTREGFVNDRLAPIFGVEAPGTDDLELMQLPEDQRAGILTHPAVLASTSHGVTHAPVLRGLLVLDRLFCESIAFPAVAVPEPRIDPGSPMPVTTRERFESTHRRDECASCHAAIDGVGFSFEHYDAVGRFRDTEFGQEVDPSGRVGSIEVADALELAQVTATDRRVPRCVTTQFYRYAMGRRAERADSCHIASVAQELATTGNLRSAVRAIALSDAFRFAPSEE